MSPDSVGPALLIASPQMKDAFFERAVVLLWHHDENGAMGVVVNKPIDHSLSEVLLSEADDLPGLDDDDHQVLWGGPVEGDAGTVVTRGDVTDDEGWPLDCGVGITRSQDVLDRLLRQGVPVALCLGYAGWGPGQLEEEIEAGGWLWTDVEPDLLFGTPPDQRYELALATLGLTPATVWMNPISE